MNAVDVKNIIEENLGYIELFGCSIGISEAESFLEELNLQNISIDSYAWAISKGLVESSIVERYFKDWLNNEELPIFIEWLFSGDSIIEAILERYPELIVDNEKLYNHSYWFIRILWAENTENFDLISERFFVEKDIDILRVLRDKLDLKGEIVDCDFSKGYISSFDYRYFDGNGYVTDTFDSFDDDIFALSDDIIGDIKYLSYNDLKIIYKYIGG